MELVVLARWIHVMAGAMWLGEVLVINAILVPVAGRMEGLHRKAFIGSVFPRVFRLASILSATAVLAGTTLYVLTYGWSLAPLAHNPLLGVGMALGILLTGFHFFMEDKLARRVGIGDPNAPMEVIDDVHLKLKIVPRVGLAVIASIFVLMMIGARGF